MTRRRLRRVGAALGCVVALVAGPTCAASNSDEASVAGVGVTPSAADAGVDQWCRAVAALGPVPAFDPLGPPADLEAAIAPFAAALRAVAEAAPPSGADTSRAVADAWTAAETAYRDAAWKALDVSVAAYRPAVAPEVQPAAVELASEAARECAVSVGDLHAPLLVATDQPFEGLPPEWRFRDVLLDSLQQELGLTAEQVTCVGTDLDAELIPLLLERLKGCGVDLAG